MIESSRSGFCVIAPVIMLIVVLISCTSKDMDGNDDLALASIGEFSVSEKHFINSFRTYYERTGRAIPVNESTLGAILDQELDIYTAVTFAQDMGWDTDAEGLFNKELIRRQVYMGEYQRRFIDDQIRVEEDDLRELFYRYNTHLRASHLFAKDRFTADSLYNLLQQGRPFEEIAAEIFQSPSLAENGGDLGYFTVDEMDVSFEDAAFSLQEGEISTPVRTSRGYSIIKLTERITRPLITEYQFAEKKNSILALADKQKKDLAKRADMANTIQGFNINYEVVRETWGLLKDNLSGDYFGGNEIQGVLSALPTHILGKKLIDEPHFALDVKELVSEALYTPEESRSKLVDFNSFLEFTEGIAFRVYAINKIRNSELKDEHFVDGSIQRTWQMHLNRRFHEYVSENTIIDDSVVKQEYEKNMHTYWHPREVNLAELAVTDWDKAEAAYQALQNGADFIQTLNTYGFDEEAKLYGGELGFIPVNKFGSLATSLSNVEKGDIAGPFEMQSNLIFIFKALGVRESRPMSFSEAEEHIKTILHQQYVDKERNKILAETRNKHDARIKYSRLMDLELTL